MRDSRIMHALVLKVDALQPHTVLVAGFVSLGYAGLLLLEGFGLWLEHSWAAQLGVKSCFVHSRTIGKDSLWYFQGPVRRSAPSRPCPVC